MMTSHIYECVNCENQICTDKGASVACPECRSVMKRIHQ